MTYLQLEQIQKEHEGNVCIFGTGLIGRTWGYDVLVAAGFTVDFYYDNKLNAGEEIVAGIKIVDFDTLCAQKQNIIVFVTVAEKYHEEIQKQLEQADIKNFYMMGHETYQDICESILAAKDEAVRERYKLIIADEEFLKRKFQYRVGYELNVENPKTFNEKLQWLKLYDRRPEYTNMVDKYEFKKYVAERIGEQYVIPTIGIWESVNAIEWDKLPEQFVLKCTHDSGSVVVCQDRRKFDLNTAITKLENCMKRNFYWGGREWPYKNVKPRIIMEPYMEDISGEIIDYKFLCYGGKCKYIFTCTERYGQAGLKVTFFDCEWNKLNITRHYPFSEKDIKVPLNYKQMLEIAERISERLPFVRIDFYEINGRLYVGEFTLYPGSGFEEFENYEDDVLLGRDIVCGG